MKINLVFVYNTLSSFNYEKCVRDAVFPDQSVEDVEIFSSLQQKGSIYLLSFGLQLINSDK